MTQQPQPWQMPSRLASETNAVYVYYRVSDEDGARAALLAALADVSMQVAGLRCQAHVRRDDAHVTMMESYALHACSLDADVLLATLERQVASRMQPWTIGPRHVERFEALGSFGGHSTREGDPER